MDLTSIEKLVLLRILVKFIKRVDCDEEGFTGVKCIKKQNNKM